MIVLRSALIVLVEILLNCELRGVFIKDHGVRGLEARTATDILLI